ncbi:hypothetical protein [Geopsychrobacter electrodiphilus]|uniref:hypothetical protein n=1 Tax=Geopsychrobacter electrodiphilus TaxID=225196 RepID=UPI0003624B15|nr:hypothetical protein [Geopsychrobacter electrodiphilus]
MLYSPSLSTTLASSCSVLKLFVIPVGGGIPAGVLLARGQGLAWPLMALIYLISDVILALIFEPLLRLGSRWGNKNRLGARIGAVFKQATARSVAHFNGTGAGPLALIMIAFGVDPMTGRASALAAGHGFVVGWMIAIAGDMLYFSVIAVSTLRLNTYIHDPNTTMLIILAAMFLMPVAVRALKVRLARVT